VTRCALRAAAVMRAGWAHAQEAAINELTATITTQFNRCKALVEGMDSMGSGERASHHTRWCAQWHACSVPAPQRRRRPRS